MGGIRRRGQRRRRVDEHAGPRPNHCCSHEYESRGDDNEQTVDNAFLSETYQSHVVVDGNEGRVFDAIAEQAEKHVKPIERQRGEYPRDSVDRVVANRDEERDVAKNTALTG